MGGKGGVSCVEKKKREKNISFPLIPSSCLRGKYNATVLSLIQDTVVKKQAAYWPCWQRDVAKEEQYREEQRKTTWGKQETMCANVCLSTCAFVCVCVPAWWQNRSSCVDTDGFREKKRKKKKKRGLVVVAVVLSVVQQPLPPAFCRVH